MWVEYHAPLAVALGARASRQRWLLCGAAVVAVCDVRARACARVVVVGGVCLVIACRYAAVVVITRTC